MSVKHAKPNFNQSQVGEILKRRFGLKPSEIRLLPSYDDQNFYVVTTEGGEYILKISNTEDSKNPNLFEVQSHAMFFLHQNGLPTQTSLPSTSGQLLIFEEMGMKPFTQFILSWLTYLTNGLFQNESLPFSGFSNGVNSLLFSYQDYTGDTKLTVHVVQQRLSLINYFVRLSIISTSAGVILVGFVCRSPGSQSHSSF